MPGDVSVVACVAHMVPHVVYKGAYPTHPLNETTKGDFDVNVRLHIWAPSAGRGQVVVVGEWVSCLPFPQSGLHLRLQCLLLQFAVHTRRLVDPDFTATGWMDDRDRSNPWK